MIFKAGLDEDTTNFTKKHYIAGTSPGMAVDAEAERRSGWCTKCCAAEKS
ncbi:hypothetical protein OK016_11890 [Vibrio chagasii]|nr:hypothetical protein [Vibrio chagasii]